MPRMNTLLDINGEIAEPKQFAFENFLALPGQISEVSSRLPGREGSGVKLSSLLNTVKLNPGVSYITLSTLGGDFSATMPIASIENEGLVVYSLNNRPLPKKKGGPLRFYIIDVESCGLGASEIDRCANVKHLRYITLTSQRGLDTRPSTKLEHAKIHPQHS